MFTEEDLPLKYIKAKKKSWQERMKMEDKRFHFIYVQLNYIGGSWEMYTNHTPGAAERMLKEGKLQQKLSREYKAKLRALKKKKK